MADTQKIEYHLMQDVKTRLENAGVSETIIVEHDQKPKTQAFIRVRCLNLSGALAGGKIPTGTRRATMAVEAYSYQDDDKDGDTLHSVTASAREAIYIKEILSTLNSLSTYNTYYGMEDGDDVPDFEEGYRIQSIQFDLIMKPAT